MEHEQIKEALNYSIQTHDLNTTITLLERGVPTSPVEDGSELTPLHHAIQSNNAIATFYLMLAGAGKWIDLHDKENNVLQIAELYNRQWFLPLCEAALQLRRSFEDWLLLMLSN